MESARIQRLAGMGALAAAGGILVLFALFVFVTIPRATSGLDLTQAAVTWISLGGAVVLLVVVHVVYGRLLLDASRRSASR